MITFLMVWWIIVSTVGFIFFMTALMFDENIIGNKKECIKYFLTVMFWPALVVVKIMSVFINLPFDKEEEAITECIRLTNLLHRVDNELDLADDIRDDLDVASKGLSRRRMEELRMLSAELYDEKERQLILSDKLRDY